MDPHFQEKAKALFFDLLKLPAAERADFLAARCGGVAALRREVESLLESHDGAGDFMTEPALGLSADSILPENLAEEGGGPFEPPESIGAYRILEVLGEGGMGMVYLAEQKEPVERQVALKVIKLGMDTREVVARFDLERQALAMMAHSGIAKVYDAGTTEQGQPYFVMEHVPGQPITQYCDEHRLKMRDRLELFIQVCDAVQHAHQKGIIHRDLKPTNILVATEGERPVLKVIDFGVARATDKRLTKKTAYTRLGTIIGTPEYMSPEQMEMGTLDIDTRTDIYTLGVLLYELLVGRLPFEFTGSGEVTYSDIQHRIRNEVPMKPSLRVSTLGAEQEAAAKSRPMDARVMGKLLKGDLDWIIMKALEKERVRRYDSASELAAEVMRYLKNEPVQAGPPSALYLLRKFVSRNRKAVSAGLALLLTLTAGLTISLMLYFVAEERKSIANQRLGDFQNLADIFLLDQYKGEAEELWPLRPEMIPRMEAWLNKAGKLAGRLGEYRTKLEEMQAHALPYDENSRRLDRATHPMAAHLANLKRFKEDWERLLPATTPEERAEGVWGNDLKVKAKYIHGETFLAEKEEEIADYEKEITRRRTWIFDDPHEQNLHDKLTRLVLDLEAFAHPDPAVGALAQVQERIEAAQRLQHERPFAHDELWEKAIASIADEGECPLYQGLRLRPQYGLLPLGRNPKTKLWEFWLWHTGKAPLWHEVRGAVIYDDSGIVMILVPGGPFLMGAEAPAEGEENLPNRDPHAYPREGPVHTVELDPYFLSKFEVTQHQWSCLSARIPVYFLMDGTVEITPGPITGLTSESSSQPDLLPQTQLSWMDGFRMLRHSGLEYPTEAQWERASRGGTTTAWHTGNDIKSIIGYANTRDMTAMEGGLPYGMKHDAWMRDGFILTAPVGCLKPNGFGFYDMMGNLYEFCRDRFDLYELPVKKGTGERLLISDDPAAFAVVRGGCFRTNAIHVRPAFRVEVELSSQKDAVGVRPVRLVEK